MDSRPASSPIPCSVQVLTHNNEANIEPCLRALADFAEVLVHDGHSTDRTLEIAGRFLNVRISSQSNLLLDPEGRIRDFGAVRNEGLGAARFPWILQVDAGEVLPAAFISEVRSAVSGSPAVYQVVRRFFLDRQRIDWHSGHPSMQIRLFHRSCTDGYTKAVHERLILHPHVIPHLFRTELPEDLPPASALPAKNAYYRQLERQRLGVLPWGIWIRHVLYRNLRTSLLLLLRLAWIWFIPRHGKRMPLVYEFSYIGQQLRLIVELCPVCQGQGSGSGSGKRKSFARQP